MPVAVCCGWWSKKKKMKWKVVHYYKINKQPKYYFWNWKGKGSKELGMGTQNIHILSSYVCMLLLWCSMIEACYCLTYNTTYIIVFLHIYICKKIEMLHCYNFFWCLFWVGRVSEWESEFVWHKMGKSNGNEMKNMKYPHLWMSLSVSIFCVCSFFYYFQIITLTSDDCKNITYICLNSTLVEDTKLLNYNSTEIKKKSFFFGWYFWTFFMEI